MLTLLASDEERHMRDLSLENTTLESTEKAVEEAPKQANSTARAKRSAEQLRFRLKEAMAQRGGSEAFLHWLREDGGKHA